MKRLALIAVLPLLAACDVPDMYHPPGNYGDYQKYTYSKDSTTGLCFAFWNGTSSFTNVPCTLGVEERIKQDTTNGR